MSTLIRGCFGYCHNSKTASDEAFKDTKRLPTIHRKVTCTQRSDVSVTAVCKSKTAKQRILSETRRNTRWRLFKMTASSFFLRNVNVERQYFKALKTEGLLVTVVSSVKCPVLNIAWFFTDGELTNTRQSFHRSFQKSNWDIVICEGITEDMKTNFNYDKINEPILDGIPCSYWFSAIEPTIPMILELFSRRHRKTNLSRLRVLDGIHDELMTRHGDTFLEQLDPDMYGPHQVLVNRRHAASFPTMELGAAAALVHNAIVSSEHQFQEPFRSRRPNHRSRCTTRPRSPPNSGQGWTPDITPQDSTDSHNSNVPMLAGTPGYHEIMIDRDPHWYIPVILQLAAFSQIQLPGIDESSDDDDAGSSGMAAASSQSQTVSNEGFDQNIPGWSRMDVENFPTQRPDISDDNPDVAIAGCSWMGTEPCSTDDNVTIYKDKTSSRSNVEIKNSQSAFSSEDEFLVWKHYSLSAGSGFRSYKSEIDDVFCVDENIGERLETLHEIVEEGNINEYVDFILESAVFSLSPIKASVEEYFELSPQYLDAVDIAEPIQPAFSQSHTGMTYGLGAVCTSTHDMEKQTKPYASMPCPNNYHDECVVDEMAMINLNQSASHYKHIGYDDKCLKSLNQTGRMVHLDQHSVKQTVLAVPGEVVVQEIDRLNRELAILNVNQSALLHTHHRLRNRCGYSPDTWFHDAYEYDYRPARLRPNEKTIHAWKTSIKTYITGMPEANICCPSEPAILRIFDGSHGPVARRYFVHCATECLQEIDDKEPWRWISTKQQRWEFQNRSELFPSGPEIAKKKQKSLFEKTPGKYVIIAEHERRNSTHGTSLKHASKKRKSKQRNSSHTAKSSKKTEILRPNGDSVKEKMDVPSGNKTTIKTDVKGKGVYRSHSRGYENECLINSSGKCITTEGTRPACKVEKSEHGFNEVSPSSEKEISEEMRKSKKQQQKKSQNSTGTDEKLTNDTEVALGDQHAENPDITSVYTEAGGRSKTAYCNHENCVVMKSTLRPRTCPKQETMEENPSCSNRKQLSQSTKKTCKGKIQGTTTNIGVSTKEQTCNRRISITCIQECKRKSANEQPSASTEETRDTYSCVTFDDNFDTNKKDISHGILPSLSESQRRRDGDYKKYISSENDADLSSSDCNEEPRRKLKVRYKKKRSVKAQLKETADGTGTCLDNAGVRYCYLSRESKQVLVNLQQHETPNNVPREGSFSERDDCEIVSACNDTMASSNVNTSQVPDGNFKDQSNETVVWAFSETDIRGSDCQDEIDEDNDTDYTEFCPSCTSSVHVQKKDDCKDTVNEDEDFYTEESFNEKNDPYWTKDCSYDTDASSSDSFIDGEGYVIVNMSDTCHSESITSTSSESFTNQCVVRASLSEITLGSRSFCSSEYSSVHKDDCTTTKNHPLCYRSAGFYFYRKSDTSLHSKPSTSLVDNSSAFGILDSDRIVSGGNSNTETGRNNIEQSRLQNVTNTHSCQDPIPSSSMEVNYRISGQSSFIIQNQFSGVTAQVNSASRGTVSFNPAEASHGLSVGIQEHGENRSNNEERPVNIREHHLRRHHDVGDWTTSVDEVRRHRESRRQRGILQYQWNGIYALSRMYENRVGQRIRRYRIRLRAWLDRHQQWFQRSN